jgi:CheY-like chemotaxis protein
VITIKTARATIGPNAEAHGSERLPAGEYVQLEVSDNGCGMTPEAQAMAFDPFFSTKAPGHGLGLSVVQGIVRVLGGAVHLVSEPGHGATFRILLPSEGEPIPPTAVTPASTTGEESYPAAGTVLIVEDEATLRLAVSKALRKKGFSVIDAGDGTTALDLIRTFGHAIGAILLDVTLPGAPSREVFAEARRLQPDIKVIVTSAYGQNKVDASFPGLQVDHFIRKPYQIGELATLLRNVLSPPSTVPKLR